MTDKVAAKYLILLLALAILHWLVSSASQSTAEQLETSRPAVAALTSPLTTQQSTAAPVLIGQVGGTPGAVAVQGSYVYLGIGTRLAALNMANPLFPALVWQSEPMTGTINSIALAGSYAYVAASGAGLRIFDLANPARPSPVAAYTGLYDCSGVAVADDYAYITGPGERLDWYSGQFYPGTLQVLSIASPQQPTLLASVSTQGSARRVAVAGSHAFVADGSYGLLVVDVSSPYSPTLAGAYSAGMFDAEDVVVSNGYAYLTGNGMHVLDVSNPAAPVATNVGEPAGVALSLVGHYAYIAEPTNGLTIVDVANPALPASVGSTLAGLGASAVAVAGDYAYVSTTNGLRFVNITNPATPSLTSTYTTDMASTRTITIAGTKAYLEGTGTGFSYIVDVTQPSQPSLLGKYPTTTDLPAASIAVTGSYAYDVNDILRILDVSNPSAPTQVGSLAASAIDIAISGKYAYLPGQSSVLVLDITNPVSPTIAALKRIGDWGGEMTLADNFAYLATDSSLKVMDVSNPASPQIVGSARGPGGVAHAVAVQGSYAYVSYSESGISTGLGTFDVSQPMTPTLVSFWPGHAWDVEVSGGYAYVVNGDHLVVIDVSDPAHPREAASTRLPDTWNYVDLAGGYIYVSSGKGGLLVFRYAPYQASLPNVARH